MRNASCASNSLGLEGKLTRSAIGGRLFVWSFDESVMTGGGGGGALLAGTAFRFLCWGKVGIIFGSQAANISKNYAERSKNISTQN